MVEAIAHLAAIETPTNDLMALRRCADAIIDMIHDATGLRAELLAVGPEQRPLVRLDLGSRPDVVYIGHFDTVHPVGTLERAPIEHRAHHLYGPGTLDMKGGVVAMIELARWLLHQHEQPNVTMIFDADEETGSVSSGPVLREVAADAEAILVFDYGDETRALRNGSRGVRFVHFTVVGRGGHAAYPERNANPVAALGDVLAFAETLNDPAHGLLITPTRIVGSPTVNVVPDRAEVSFDLRGSSETRLLKAVKALTSFRLQDTELSLVADVVNAAPTFEVTEDNRATKLALQAYEELDWEPVPMIEARGASDANQVAAANSNVLDGFGGWGGGPHSLDEFLDVRSVPYCAALAGTITQLALAQRGPSEQRT